MARANASGRPRCRASSTACRNALFEPSKSSVRNFAVPQRQHHPESPVRVRRVGRLDDRQRLLQRGHRLLVREAAGGNLPGADEEFHGSVGRVPAAHGKKVGSNIRRPRVEVAGMDRFQLGRRPSVQPGTTGRAQLRVEHVTEEPVLELEDAHRSRTLTHQTCRHRRLERIDHLVTGQVEDPLDDRHLELGPDDRRRSEYPPAQVIEAPDPTQNDIAHGLGDAEPPMHVLIERGQVGETDVEQVPRELLHEEGIALRLPIERGAQSLRQAGHRGRSLRRPLQGLVDEPVDLLAGQPRESNPGGPDAGGQIAEESIQGPIRCAVVVAPRRNQQDPQIRTRASQMPDQEVGCLRSPLEVVDDEEDRLDLGGGGQPGRDRLEQPVSGRLGVGRRRRCQPGEPVSEFRDQPDQLAGAGSQFVPQIGGGALPEKVSERLDDGLVRHVEFVVASTEQHGGSVAVSGVGHLGGEPALADAGFTGDEGQMKAVGVGGPPQPLELCPFAFPADEGRVAGRERPRQGGHHVGFGRPRDLVGGHRTG